MNIEVEVATQVYRIRELHEDFSLGKSEEKGKSLSTFTMIIRKVRVW